MNRLLSELEREITREYIRRGMDVSTAANHGRNLSRLIVSRYNLGVPEEYLTAGMDGFLKKIFKSVKKVIKKVEKKVIRPITHWKYLSVVANVIPGYGQILSGAIAAGQTARQLYKGRRDMKKNKREFEREASKAYREYQEEILKRNMRPMSFDDFKNAIQTQAF